MFKSVVVAMELGGEPERLRGRWTEHANAFLALPVGPDGHSQWARFTVPDIKTAHCLSVALHNTSRNRHTGKLSNRVQTAERLGPDGTIYVWGQKTPKIE